MPFLRLVACTAALVCTTLTTAAASNATVYKPSFMRVHGQALPPFGYVEFCQRHRSECVTLNKVNFSRFDATPLHLRELDQLNRDINTRIKPATDLELYGCEEYWTFPVTHGDCEDYVLLKRRELMARGWPASALLITVVRDEEGDGHAVLTVRTRQGDFILDNKVDDVRLWNQTPYHYLMRQSYLSPTVWMALDPRIESDSASVAGVKASK